MAHPHSTPLDTGRAGRYRRSTPIFASTRSDCSGHRTRSQASIRGFYRQFPYQTAGESESPDAFCYDKAVWKRLALRHGQEFLRHVIPAILKPIHALWNEVIGFIFLSLGTIFAFKTVRYAVDRDVPRLLIGGLSTLIMAWYGISSFLKARRISRS